MRVGVPTEIKPGERRVALTPAGARELAGRGHAVLVQTGAGRQSGFGDASYREQGATIVPDSAAVFGAAELVVKVKEPQPAEVALLGPGHLLFTYLHLAASDTLARALCASGATCIAYETVQDEHGRLPLLAPMSEIAGRLAAQVAAFALTAPGGGRGALVGGAPGTPPAEFVVLGGGVVGANAARVAAGMGAAVTIFDTSLERLRQLDLWLGPHVRTRFATSLALEEMLPVADVVIGAVLVKAARAPHLVRRDQLGAMKRGAVLVDVSIDQGGCFETSRPTTHDDPIFEVDGIVHYCVENMPAAVPVTSTPALTSATLPYILRLADGGGAMLDEDPALRAGLSIRGGAQELAA